MMAGEVSCRLKSRFALGILSPACDTDRLNLLDEVEELLLDSLIMICEEAPLALRLFISDMRSRSSLTLEVTSCCWFLICSCRAIALWNLSPKCCCCCRFLFLGRLPMVFKLRPPFRLLLRLVLLVPGMMKRLEKEGLFELELLQEDNWPAGALLPAAELLDEEEEEEEEAEGEMLLFWKRPEVLR